MRILFVDDHQEMRDLVRRLYETEGYTVSTAADGEAMWATLAEAEVDLLVLDLMLPGTDGLTLCREVRAAHPTLPIIMLTARGEEIDRVVGLELGADDYVVKPFAGRELIARTRAVLRRARQPVQRIAPPTRAIYRFAGWRLMTATRELQSDEGTVVSLSTTEYNLLLAFVEHRQTVLSRDQLLDLTKGREATPFDRSIDNNVSRLRRKLGDAATDSAIIKTVWGGGYMFTPAVIRE